MIAANSSPPYQAVELSIHSNGLPETKRFAAAISRALTAGDVLCVTGPLGAGKSELCRAIIRERAGDPLLEVPSPSYTLVNVYDDMNPPVWHADLYRIGDESELGEIGLQDAVGHSIVLVEWPDRWLDLPERRVDVTITPGTADYRQIAITPLGAGWEEFIFCVKGSV